MGTNLPVPKGNPGPPSGWDQVIQMSKNMPNTEDSGLSIAGIVFASLRPDFLTPSVALNLSNVFLPWVVRRFARCPTAILNTSENSSSALIRAMACATVERKEGINSFASEFFAGAILRRLGIPSVPARIVTAKEARDLPGRWVVKAIAPTDGRLHFIAGSELLEDDTKVLVSEVPPDSASFDFVRRKILKQSPDNFASGTFGELYRKASPSFAEVSRQITETFTRAIGKSVESADGLFTGFHATAAELAVIEREAKWNGAQFERICAARIFIGCGFAHNANFLITRSGTLISIDHTSANLESGEDLGMLFRFTMEGTREWRILREIAALTEADITAAVEEIPKHPACGDLTPLAPYFVERLRLWQRLAGVGAPAAATASPAV